MDVPYRTLNVGFSLQDSLPDAVTQTSHSTSAKRPRRYGAVAGVQRSTVSRTSVALACCDVYCVSGMMGHCGVLFLSAGMEPFGSYRYLGIRTWKMRRPFCPIPLSPQAEGGDLPTPSHHPYHFAASTTYAMDAPTTLDLILGSPAA